MKNTNIKHTQASLQNSSFGIRKLWLFCLVMISRWPPSSAIRIELSNPDSHILVSNMMAISSSSSICQDYVSFDNKQVGVICSKTAQEFYQNNPKAYNQDKEELQIVLKNISRKDISAHCEIKTVVSDEKDKFKFTLASGSEFVDTVAFFRHQENSIYFQVGLLASAQQERILRHEVRHSFHAFQNRQRKIFKIPGGKSLSFPFGSLNKDFLAFKAALRSAHQRLNQIIQVYDFEIINNHIKTTYGKDKSLALNAKNKADFMNFVSKNVIIKTELHQKTILEFIFDIQKLDSAIVKKFHQLQELNINYAPFIFKDVYLTDFNSWLIDGYIDKDYQILKPIEFISSTITHHLVKIQQLSPKKFDLFTTTVSVSDSSQSLRAALADQYYMQNHIVRLYSGEAYQLGEADAFFYQVFDAKALKIIAPELLQYNEERLGSEYKTCLRL